MKYRIFFLFIFCLMFMNASFIIAQDTFSICAVDSVTGQVGSAGATCISSSTTSAIIISDVHPGVGVIHTQASYLGVNQIRARNYMNQGLSAQQIIDSIITHDYQNNPAVRQYGVVKLDSVVQSAGYTGVNCSDYKNHITGPGYAIQGNILAGQQILDSIQSRFLNTNGNLACRLMAALQGAKVPGADTRCNAFGISTFSAFIRVANPGDTAGHFFLDITVNTYPNHIEPIDTLQTLFDLWGGCNASYIDGGKQGTIKCFPNPVENIYNIESTAGIKEAGLYSIEGKIIKNISITSSNELHFSMDAFNRGIYYLRLELDDHSFRSVKVVKL